MRLVTFCSSSSGEPAPGVLLPNGSVLNLGVALNWRYASVAAVMRHWDAALPMIYDALNGARPDSLVPPKMFRLLPPLGERVLIACAGANYRSHLAEMGEEQTEELAWFVQNPNSVIGPGDAIVLPERYPDKVDFEGELCVVFGRRCHNVDAEDAMSYVGGYTIINDVSARDALGGLAAAQTPAGGRYAWMNMLLGKQFPTFCPMGPSVVTADEIGDPGALQLTTTVNGEVMQDANTSDLSIGIPQLIARLSEYFVFEPGDVLSTGTPAGVGAGRTPPVYLRPGDVVEVAVEGIGTLSNTIGNSAANALDTEQELQALS
jgi:2-keto-4-pentenoate hydratase/2-oxohepta-3-ene-1,7-dioic acid hydratase in catechol pathway